MTRKRNPKTISDGKKDGRPETKIDFEDLASIMRMKPTLADTAAFFKCSERTVERHIKQKFNLTFVEFREQNMVHTRLGIQRKAIQKAMNGDNVMLIFCLKNLCDWRDKLDQSVSGSGLLAVNQQAVVILPSNGREIKSEN